MNLIVSPAGSNISYIRYILSKSEQIEGRLSYHDNRHNEQGKISHSLEIEHPRENMIKIYFEKFHEVIILNWHYKFRVYPTEYMIGEKTVKEYGDEWTATQKEHWKNFKNNWETRAVLHWFYKIYNDKNYQTKLPSPARNFNGASLYESYHSAKQEFGKFGIDYTEEKYMNWQKSQEVVLNSLKIIRNIKKIEEIKKLMYDFEKGVALGLFGVMNNLSEENTWQEYIK